MAEFSKKENNYDVSKIKYWNAIDPTAAAQWCPKVDYLGHQKMVIICKTLVLFFKLLENIY